MRFLNAAVLTVALVLVPVMSTFAQSSPQAYSAKMIQTEMMTGRLANFSIYRDGAKEIVIMSVAPWPDMPKGIYKSVLFDFQAHKMYTRDVNEKTCRWMRYTSARAPLYYDPISGSEMALAEISAQKPKVERKATVNGFETTFRVYPRLGGKGLLRFWIADDSNIVVQMQSVDPDGTISNRFEIKQLAYEKPAATLLAIPANCTETQGEASESGMSAHVEVHADVTMSGEKQLSTNTEGEKTHSTRTVSRSSKTATVDAGGLPLGKWEFKGRDSKGVVWSGNLVTTKSSDGTYECNFKMLSKDSDRANHSSCDYDPAKRKLTMESPTGSFLYIATLSPEGTSLVSGEWRDDDFGNVSKGTWSARLSDTGAVQH